jgi:anti-anti-sigma regulatory factor
VSECHDLYEDGRATLSAPPKAEGTQCHDAYSSTLGTGGVLASPAHECYLVSGHDGPVRVVRVLGHLDWATSPRFDDLMRHDCTDREVIIDLSSTTSDAAGTGNLLVATAHAKARGQQLVFVVTDPLELAVLESVGLDQVMPIVDSESAGLEWLAAHPVPEAAVGTGR